MTCHFFYFLLSQGKFYSEIREAIQILIFSGISEGCSFTTTTVCSFARRKDVHVAPLLQVFSDIHLQEYSGIGRSTELNSLMEMHIAAS